MGHTPQRGRFTHRIVTNIDQVERGVKRNDAERGRGPGYGRGVKRYPSLGGLEVGVGLVEGIYVAGSATAPPVPVERVEAVAGAGLSGDRYASGTGTFSRVRKPGRHVTFV